MYHLLLARVCGIHSALRCGLVSVRHVLEIDRQNFSIERYPFNDMKDISSFFFFSFFKNSALKLRILEIFWSEE